NIDPDGDSVTLSVKAGFEPSNGDVEFISTTIFVGTETAQLDGYRYEPDPDFNGSESFTIVADDGNGGTAEQEVSVTITPVNDDPTALALSNDTIQENVDGAVVGTLTTEDVDLGREGDTHTYDIQGVVDEQGNAVSNLFEISGDTLKLKDDANADFEASTYFDVDVRTTDSAGSNLTETFRVLIEDDPSDDGLGSGFELVSVDDWFNPAWGGGFNATFEYTIQDDDVIDGTVSAWTIEPLYTGNGTISTGWSSFGPVAFGDFGDGFEITTVGQGWQREASPGDVITFSLQVLGDGFDEDDFAFDFLDEDPPLADPAAGDFSVDASTAWRWQGDFGQNVSITNGATDPSDGWTVKLDLDPGEAISINNVWGADAELVGGDWFFTAKSYNGALNPGQSAGFGFNATNLNGDTIPVEAADYAIV
ncbi:MAG: cellulose binding domain-containing protein, partial [Myxococcota bacterium]